MATADTSTEPEADPRRCRCVVPELGVAVAGGRVAVARACAGAGCSPAIASSSSWRAGPRSISSRRSRARWSRPPVDEDEVVTTGGLLAQFLAAEEA